MDRKDYDNMKKTLNCEVITAYVYRNNVLGDCTNNGISKERDTLKIITNQYIDFYINYPEFRTILHESFLREYMEENKIDVIMLPDTKHIFCIPLIKGIETIPTRFLYGGNLLYSSDSRFYLRTPLRIHDRLE